MDCRLDWGRSRAYWVSPHILKHGTDVSRWIFARAETRARDPRSSSCFDRRPKLDERRQRALTRYYIASGAGGIAVGVHTTQFAIREPEIGLFRPVLELAAEEIRGQDMVAVAGAVGHTTQAMREAGIARDLGYDAVLLSLGALKDAPVRDLITHVRAVADILPVFGFYLQPSVGGRLLSYDFWREFVEIDNVVAIKMAPFNRYQTIDVVRAVAESGRDIVLYTGNDDTILIDLLTEYVFGAAKARIVGGCWATGPCGRGRPSNIYEHTQRSHAGVANSRGASDGRKRRAIRSRASFSWLHSWPP